MCRQKRPRLRMRQRDFPARPHRHGAGSTPAIPAGLHSPRPRQQLVFPRECLLDHRDADGEEKPLGSQRDGDSARLASYENPAVSWREKEGSYNDEGIPLAEKPQHGVDAFQHVQ